MCWCSSPAPSSDKDDDTTPTPPSARTRSCEDPTPALLLPHGTAIATWGTEEEVADTLHLHPHLLAAPYPTLHQRQRQRPPPSAQIAGLEVHRRHPLHTPTPLLPSPAPHRRSGHHHHQQQHRPPPCLTRRRSSGGSHRVAHRPPQQPPQQRPRPRPRPALARGVQAHHHLHRRVRRRRQLPLLLLPAPAPPLALQPPQPRLHRVVLLIPPFLKLQRGVDRPRDGGRRLRLGKERCEGMGIEQDGGRALPPRRGLGRQPLVELFVGGYTCPTVRRYRHTCTHTLPTSRYSHTHLWILHTEAPPQLPLQRRPGLGRHAAPLGHDHVAEPVYMCVYG